jgi:hypothetical protein
MSTCTVPTTRRRIAWRSADQDERPLLDAVEGLDHLGAIDLIEARQLSLGQGGERKVGCSVGLR